MSLHPLAAAVLAAVLVPAAPRAAAAEPADAQPRELDRITVTATRTARAVADVPATVDLIDRERMDRTLVRDLGDLFRYEPGISVGSDVARFGIGDIRIRGLGGNRVAILADGIPVADAFSIGSFSNAGRNLVDLDTLKRVEVVRGPGSALYGSDALGGVVAFVGKDPEDYLAPGRDAASQLKLGYHGATEGWFLGATSAFRGERWSGLVVAGHRQGHARDNQGTTGGDGSARTRPNPQDTDGRSLLARLVLDVDPNQRLRLTVEGNEDRARTDVRSQRGFSAATGAIVADLQGDDLQTRARVALVHEVDAMASPFADSLHWQVYRQDSETTQETAELRIAPASVGQPNQRRERSFGFDQRRTGAMLTLHKHVAAAGIAHDLTYGLDLARTELAQKRDGRATNLLTGGVTNVISPDVFPVRDFPLSRTTTAALYLQDEMALAGGRLLLVPGVRVDRYELAVRADPIFEEDNPGVAVSDLARTRVSPKFGAVWRLGGDWSLYAGYASGFRAPPYDDVNMGFTNLQFGYTALPNPDLRPETSDGYEIGLRRTGARGYLSVSGFLNRYDDFIESQRFVGFNEAGLMVFQSQNVTEAEIRGAELKAGLELGALASALEGWSLRAAAAYARGENRSEGVPLGDVDPFTAALGLAYDAPRWRVELAARGAARNDRRPPVAGATAFEPPGYVVFDLFGGWDLAPGMRLDAGVFNLADRTWWGSGAVVAGLAEGSPALLRYTQPGRHVGASLQVSWP
ncbi:TonB-dependent hemoglobin/transferrin/lactoferrin family receptor [Coralloluteibacterium thermophilus]|uniref:TonB-dependent hemoglobin/transferrin/lactoferrin family receptor n=1 Tax=Coralloluteibacterium thermophilum TaxID=2707049 RepID=A0ABV9NH24_9GAMM